MFSACTGKREFWTEQQEKAFLEACKKRYVDPVEKRSDKKLMLDLCDCKYQVTSRKYTPEEAQRLSRNQVMDLMEECNYNW